MKKQYQLLLCEDRLINNELVPVPCYELAAADSEFAGSAFNIEFYSKIDGTHELNFEMPEYYFNENNGKYEYNTIIEHLINKAKIEVRKENKSYLVVINEINEEEKDGLIYFSYSCIDAYIEELSKNGYGISFSDEVDLHNGLGTIHEFAEKVAKNTDWKYMKDKTGTLLEYKKELEYNISQARYDYVYNPVPVHPIKYIPELEQYCQETKLICTENGISHKIYCYDKTEQITSKSVQNLIYNAKDFTDTSGWSIYCKNADNKMVSGAWNLGFEKKTIGDENNYYLSIDVVEQSIKQGYLLNSTAMEAGKIIEAGIPYYFRLDSPDPNLSGWKISAIEIYDGNPILDSNSIPAHTLTFTEDFKVGREYILRSDVYIAKPYFAIKFSNANSDFPCYISEILLFQITGQEVINSKGELLTAEYNSNILIKALYSNGMFLEGEYAQYSGIIGTNYANGKTGIIQYPETAIPNSSTLKYTQYFYRTNYALQDNIEYGIQPTFDNTIHYLTIDEVLNLSNLPLTEVDILPEDPKLNTVYLQKKDNKYYQYYSIDYKGRTGGKWDYAFLDEGYGDKRRTLNIKNSNRFNIIQELAELFNVWPVFNISRQADNTLEKQFWFKEDCIKENFAGFHKDVNLLNMSRTIDSNEIVTKMYVENQETDLSPNGFVSIVNSNLNPWGENYYYDFSYFVNQKILNTFVNGKPQVQVDLETLYTSVKSLNTSIISWNEELSTVAAEKRDQVAKSKSLSISIAAMNERVSRLIADKKEYEMLLLNSSQDMPDYQNTVNSLNNYEKEKQKLEDELSKIETAVKELEKKVDILQDKISLAIQDKKDLIFTFENKYIHYIKEGVWSDNSYSDDDAYYIDSLKVMATSAMPRIDWKISVLDGSITDELEEFNFEVGDKTILVDDSFFFPEEEGVKNFTFEVLISGTKEFFDNPQKNEIEVRNYTTSFEELFTRISAATQSLQLNEQIYNKSAYFTVNGEIDASILQKTLSNNSLILANSTDNTYTVDDTGITVHKINNSNKQVRINAEGLFVANSLDENGQLQWKTGITADGISASLITSGEINTSVIKIFSKGQPTFSWNNLGISAYEQTGLGKIKSSSFIRLDQYGLYKVDNDDADFNYDTTGLPWFNGLSRQEAIKKIQNNSIVSLTDNGFRLNVKESGGLGSIILGYEKDRSYGLYINDSKGNTVVKLQNTGINEIAGWQINDWGLSKTRVLKDGKTITTGFQIPTYGNENGNAFAIGSPNEANWTFAPFRVTHKGDLYATGAHIEGEIRASSGYIGNWKDGNGNNNGWKITTQGIESSFNNGKYYVALKNNNGASGSTAAFLVQQDGDSKFYVRYDGRMYAKDAVVEGTINATKGSFSGAVTIGGESVATYSQVAQLLKSDNSVAYYINGGRIGGWYASETTLANQDNSVILSTDGISFHESSFLGMDVGGNYVSQASLTTTQISVPVNFKMSVINPTIIYRKINSACLTFRVTNPAIGVANQTGSLYFTGGGLMFNIGDDTYQIDMTKL